jgi:hypothetical protein
MIADENPSDEEDFLDSSSPVARANRKRHRVFLQNLKSFE